MKRLILAIPLVIFAAFAGLAFFGMQREDTDSLPSAFVGKVAPALDFGEFPGKPIIEGLPEGVSLVNFWASWCAPCRAEHPNISWLSQQGLPIIGVNYRDDRAKARAFLDELGDPYTALGTDDNARGAIEWGVYGLPETFVISPEGTVLMRFAGPVTQRAINAQLRPLLETYGVTLPAL